MRASKLINGTNWKGKWLLCTSILLFTLGPRVLSQETAAPTETPTPAETPESSESDAVALSTSITETWRMGVQIDAGTAQCGGIFATFPVPGQFPEQTAKLVNQNVSPYVTAYRLNQLSDGLQRIEISIDRLPAGNAALVTFDIEVEKVPVTPPEDTSSLVIPERPSRELRNYLTGSPYIDPRHGKIRNALSELELSKETPAWQQVEAIYDWVREKVEYKEGEIKTAIDALDDGYGDCEELTSLFVAMCRASRIPARMVWVPGHCYPEFYLEDAEGNGAWYPCQAAGTRQFGGMVEPRPILQKGDKFKVPEKRHLQRYVSEFAKIDAVKGSGKPSVTFIQERLEE